LGAGAGSLSDELRRSGLRKVDLLVSEKGFTLSEKGFLGGWGCLGAEGGSLSDELRRSGLRKVDLLVPENSFSLSEKVFLGV
jgi:hypothetical protein